MSAGETPAAPGSATELGRTSGVMALGTIGSRATGFLRVAVVAAAIGSTTQVADAYNVANTAPNIIYELLLGGVLTSVIVPVLIRVARASDDEGTAFGQLLVTLVTVALGVTAVLSVIAAPFIVRLYLNDVPAAERELAITFARFLLPQILFYGIGAVIGAVLNTRGRFGAPMAAPILNNLIVVATAVVFMLLPGPRPPEPVGMTTAQTMTLAIGTTLGVVVMTVALLPALRQSGFRWRWRFDLRHPGLRSIGALGRWVLLYVVANQLGYVVIARLASSATGFTTYAYAFLLFQLPHAIVAVSVITALLPRMSRHAADGDLHGVREDLSQGLRLTAVVLIPAAVGYVVLSRQVAVAVFSYGVNQPSDAALIGSVLAAFAVGLVFFSAFQLQLRAFYAMADSRTPALVNIAVNAVNVGADLLLFHMLDGTARIVGLAAGYVVSYVAGSAIFAVLLNRRLGGLDGRRMLRTLTRITVAAAIAGLGVYGASRLVLRALGTGPGGAAAAVLVGGLAGVALYATSARRMRVGEMSVLAGVIRARLRP